MKVHITHLSIIALMAGIAKAEPQGLVPCYPGKTHHRFPHTLFIRSIDI